MRRLLFMFGIIFALITLGVAVYLLFFRGEEGVPGQNANDNPFGGIESGLSEPRSVEIPEVGVPIRGAGEEVAPRLYKITEGPVAHGAVAFSVQVSEDIGTSTVTREDLEVRYVDRASGNIYRFRLHERTLERVTNLTLPGIQEAVWASDGSRAFLRFYSTEVGEGRIETYALSVSSGEGYLLEPDISDVVVTGTSSVLSVLPSTNGSVGTRATLAGTNPATVFSTQLSAIKTHRAGASYAATTKPSAFIPGYAFSISRGGEFTRILGPLLGLSLLPSPSGTRHLYSYRDGGALRLALFDAATNEAVALPVATLAEKCAWMSDSETAYCGVPRSISGTFPDDWYLGLEQTSDRIWRIDMKERVATLEFDPSVLADADIDAVALALDPENEVLVFTNRDDGSLWLYDL